MIAENRAKLLSGLGQQIWSNAWKFGNLPTWVPWHCVGGLSRQLRISRPRQVDRYGGFPEALYRISRPSSNPFPQGQDANQCLTFRRLSSSWAWLAPV